MTDQQPRQIILDHDGLISLSPGEFKEMIREAAAAGAADGARMALERVGLHDEHAGDDVRQLRSLLDSFRVVKRSALSTLGGFFMKAILLGLLMLAAVKTGYVTIAGGKP